VEWASEYRYRYLCTPFHSSILSSSLICHNTSTTHVRHLERATVSYNYIQPALVLALGNRQSRAQLS
jgi:hypothetical protein